ncbi:YbjN domain-containing protein [Ferrimonas marina]|uniref:Putative sensory transduction regulator n=1 Tax=Ferrimonas marina TaxID=299255 RepID=A0A1M5N1E7_9GAMM|nr:YbjN domain-containing protein [Ferrimonas marina]SHG83384.1 Putative sensory transduction regulator [Ferrimonas marina]
MPALLIPDHETLKAWLDHGQIPYYLCGSCQGLHLNQLQECPGIYDAKVEIEGDFLYLSASIEVRPAGLMTAFAEMSRLNTHFPTLKIFIEMVDESLPRILMCHNLALSPGMSQSQFLYFVQDCMDQMGQAAAEVNRLGVVYQGDEEPEEEAQPAPERALMH